MKNKILLAILAIALVSGMTLSACKEAAAPTSREYVSTDDDYNKYTLVITDSAAKAAVYTPKNGDSYVLTITFADGTTKTSSGTVTGKDGNDFTLKPKDTETSFTVTISSEGMTAIKGTIVTDKGDVPAPANLKPVTSGDNSSSTTIVSGAEVNNPGNIALPPSLDFSYLEKGNYLNNFLDGTSSVTVKDEKVTIKLGVPKDKFLYVVGSNDFFGQMGEGVIINPSNAKGHYIGRFYTEDEKYYLVCRKDGNSWAYLLYVDKDVTIKGTDTYTFNGEKWTDNWNVSLKTGWNYLISSGNDTTISTTASIQQPFAWTVFED